MPVGYKIDPNAGRTVPEGIRQGGAQVFDLGMTERTLARNAAAEEAKRLQKEKQRQSIQEDIQNNLSKMGQIAIMPKDQQLFAQDAAKIQDHVRQNIDALKNGDINAMMDFQQMFGNYMTKAEQSKNFREKWEQNGQMIAKDPELYDQDVKDAHLARASSPDAGNWVDDPTIYHKTINYQNRIMDQLRPYAESAATKTPGKTTFTRAEAEKLIENDLTDPAIFNQAIRDFKRAQASGSDMGATDPIDYYKKKHADKLLVKDKNVLPEYYINGGNKNNINVTKTVTDDGGEIHIMDPKTNEEVRVKYDKQGNVIGGIRGTRLTQEEKSQNDKIAAENYAREREYNQALRKAQVFRAKIGDNATAEEYKTLQGMIPDRKSVAYKQETLPYKEKEINLPAQEAQEIAFDKFKVKPQDIINGENTGNVEVQKLKEKTITPDEFNAQWSKLKKGQSLVGPDGQTYYKQ